LKHIFRVGFQKAVTFFFKRNMPERLQKKNWRERQNLCGKTPAQTARTNIPNNWKGLIDEATKKEAKTLANALTPKVENRERIKGG
jgi:hypothetical protein